MGTFLCIVPVHAEQAVLDLSPARRSVLMDQGLNLEHHAAPGRFVSFLYNQGGSLVRWYRDTLARAERDAAASTGRDVYPELFAELPPGPSPVLVLPHFSVTGPPRFLSDTSGVMAGLTLATTRGDILRGILEGATYYLRACVERLPEAGIEIQEFRAVGGGSRSDTWVQLSADILGRPFRRPHVAEAGALGAAILAAAGTGRHASIPQGARAMVRLGDAVDPDPGRRAQYEQRYARYREMVELLGDFPGRARPPLARPGSAARREKLPEA
jgi:sugar (pentulose or hexulose) kinase